jgi:hypothetical protein
MDESPLRPDGQVELLLARGQEHYVARFELRLPDAPEMFVEPRPNFSDAVAGNPVIASHSIRRNPERRKHESHAVDATLASSLETKARPDERLRARRIIHCHRD